MASVLGFATVADYGVKRIPRGHSAPAPEPVHSEAELKLVEREVAARVDELLRRGVRVTGWGIVTGRYVNVEVESDVKRARRLLADLGDKVSVEIGGFTRPDESVRPAGAGR